MKFFSETSASNQLISIHSVTFFKHGRSGKFTKKINVMKTFNFIFILIMVVHISISSSYYQRDVKPQEDEIPHFKEHHRDRNPLRLRPRMWTCENGKCIRRLMDHEDKRKPVTKYESDNRLALFLQLIQYLMCQYYLIKILH